MSLFVVPFLRYGEVLVENRQFEPTHLDLAPPYGVTPFKFRRDLWRQKTRVHGYRMALFVSPFIVGIDRDFKFGTQVDFGKY